MEPVQPEDHKQAVEHVAGAHKLLEELREELNEHPALEDAIQKLELALSLLTTKTGGLL
jgi:predicted translin family RNA/ssDNA-binding protein